MSHAPPPRAISFRHHLSPAESASWQSLCERLRDISLSNEPRGLSWHLKASNQFSVKSLYVQLSKHHALDVARLLWNANHPSKWKVSCGKCIGIISRRPPTLLSEMGLQTIMVHFMRCKKMLTTSFRCPLARFTWSVVREASGLCWDPALGADLISWVNSLCAASKRVMWRYVGAPLWAFW